VSAAGNLLAQGFATPQSAAATSGVVAAAALLLGGLLLLLLLQRRKRKEDKAKAKESARQGLGAEVEVVAFVVTVGAMGIETFPQVGGDGDEGAVGV
jgi:hypothetical protein